MLSATLTFAQTHDCYITEIIKQRQINFIFHEGSKSATPYDQYAERANNINFIFMRDQNSPPPLTNVLIREAHKLYLHEGSKFATPSEQYVDWDNNINFIFMRD